MPDQDPFTEFGGKAVDQKPSASSGDPFAEFGGKAEAPRELSKGFTGKEVVDFGKGAAKGAAHTLGTIGNVVTYPFYKATKGETLKEGQKKVDEAFKPESGAEKTGQSVEQFAEFFIPVGGEYKLAAGAPRWAATLAAAGKSAVETALKTYAQTGDLSASLKAAGVGAIGGAAASQIPKSIRPIMKNRMNQEEQASINELEKRGVPLSAADKTGSKVGKAVEQKIGYLPGSSGVISDFQTAQRNAAGNELAKIPGATGGQAATAEETGQGVEKAFKTQIYKKKSEADEAYNKVRSELAKTRKQQVTGYKESKALDASGKPVQTPVYSEVEAPVAMGPVRAALKPYYDELAGRLPVTVRDASPGFSTLKAIIEGKESQIDALKLDQDLSAVKAFLRREGSGIKDKSGRLGAVTVAELEKNVQAAIGTASPEALSSLKAGREAVRSYREDQEALARLLPDNRSPVAAYQRLTEASGRLTPDLRRLQEINPEAVKTVGRTYLQGMIDDITNEGGVKNLGRGLQTLRKLQPETREILFGKEQAKEIEDFLAGLKRVGADTNPSGTAKWAAITEALTGTGAAIAGLYEGQSGPAAGMAMTAVATNRLAKMLTTPEGTKALTRVLNVPEGSKAALSRAVQAVAAQAQKQDPDAQRQYPDTGVKVKQ